MFSRYSLQICSAVCQQMPCFVALTTVMTADLAAQRVPITHGPMLGHVTSDSISIWARTSTPGQFRVRYGTAPDQLDQVSAPVATTLDRDNTGWVRLTGLKPNTRYYYQPVTIATLEQKDLSSRFRPPKTTATR